MKAATFLTTLAVIVAGTVVVGAYMMLPFLALFFAPIPLAPLFFTLWLCRRLSGLGAQAVLLTSTLLLAVYLTRWFFFACRPDGTVEALAMFYPWPFMLGFWTLAGFLHLRARAPNPALERTPTAVTSPE